MEFNHSEAFWTVFGFVGQGLFFMRFFVQWIASEKKKKSIIPTSFWYFSLSGAILLLIYSIHLESWPFIIGQLCGFTIYARNLILIARHKESKAIK